MIENKVTGAFDTLDTHTLSHIPHLLAPVMVHSKTNHLFTLQTDLPTNRGVVEWGASLRSFLVHIWDVGSIGCVVRSSKVAPLHVRATHAIL